MLKAGGESCGRQVAAPTDSLWVLRIEQLVGDAICVPPQVLQMTRRQVQKCTQLNQGRSTVSNLQQSNQQHD